MAAIVGKAMADRGAAGNPIRVVVIGAGFMGEAVARHILRYEEGITLIGICNRHPGRAVQNAEEGVCSGAPVARADTMEEMQRARERGAVLCTSNAELVTLDEVECVVEATGTTEYAAQCVMLALEAGKPVVTTSAELDCTIGPILHAKAKHNGVVFTSMDGDQPGVIMNLYRYVKSLGIRPVVAGNVKAFHNVYRNPSTQKDYSDATGVSPLLATCACDGTKVAAEQAVVANATGMSISKRGMNGFMHGHPVDNVASLYNAQELAEGSGIVDYVIGPTPAPSIYVVGMSEDPVVQKHLKYYKQGKGPLYTFYTPYHLCHFDVPSTIGRAVCFNDAVCAPLAGPVVEVISVMKKEGKAGEVLDGIGGFFCYGIAETSSAARSANLLPIGLCKGCVLTRDVARDQLVTFADVTLPEGRLSDRLWFEQLELFGLAKPKRDCQQHAEFFADTITMAEGSRVASN